MARSRKAPTRAPLMESDTEAALRRRGSELVGLVLIVLAALMAALIWTYSPDDPSLFSATDEAPRNALGLVGASLADPLHRALGWGAYGIAAALGVWGLRMLFHTGEGRALRRSIALPVALFVAAAFAATHVPPADWPKAYGLGGLLGDAALANLIGLVPLDVTVALPLVSVALAATFVLSAGYALGVTWAEARGFLRFLGLGSVVVYAGAHKLTGRAASGAARGAAGGARAAKSFAAGSKRGMAPVRGAGGASDTARRLRASAAKDFAARAPPAAPRAAPEAARPVSLWAPA